MYEEEQISLKEEIDGGAVFLPSILPPPPALLTAASGIVISQGSQLRKKKSLSNLVIDPPC